MSNPGFNQGLQQRQSQSLVLAPQLRQSLKILQVAALDLRSVIQEELQTNPALEELPMEGMTLEQTEPDGRESDAVGDDDGPAVTAPSDNPEDGADKSREMDFSKEFDILGKFEEDGRDGTGSRTYTAEDAERRQHFFDSLVSETSLTEHLMQQAELSGISPPALEAMRTLVSSLDDRGFLVAKPADVALQTGLPLAAV